jgi:hypothetical protein
MSTRLVSIVRIEEHQYEVTFDTEGVRRVFTCVVNEANGVRYFKATPDPWPGLAVGPRALGDALEAFEQINTRSA